MRCQPDRGPQIPSRAEIVSLAQEKTKNRSCFTYMVGLLLVPARLRPFFFCAYAYFRLVDDLADSDGPTFPEKHSFLERQRALVHSLYGRQPAVPPGAWPGEFFLDALVDFDRQRGAQLQGPILDLLSCIRYDIGRLGVLPARSELDRYIEREITSYLKIFLYFCSPGVDLNDFSLSYEGLAGKWSHLLRDFLLDLKRGLINLSREDQDAFRIDLGEVGEGSTSAPWHTWVSQKVKEAERNFQRGQEISSSTGACDTKSGWPSTVPSMHIT